MSLVVMQQTALCKLVGTKPTKSKGVLPLDSAVLVVVGGRVSKAMGLWAPRALSLLAFSLVSLVLRFGHGSHGRSDRQDPRPASISDSRPGNSALQSVEEDRSIPMASPDPPTRHSFRMGRRPTSIQSSFRLSSKPDWRHRRPSKHATRHCSTTLQ